MTLIRKDRVQETSTSSGTGAKVLAGAVQGYQAFSAACANNDTVECAITDGTNWEVGLYTYSSGANSLTISGVPYASSNAGAVVNFSGATLNIFNDIPAHFFATAIPTVMNPVLTGDVTSPGASTATTLATVNSDVGAFTNANITVNAKGLVTAAANGSGGGLTIGTTTITSGTTTRVLYDNAGVLGEYTISGSGNVAMTTSPVFTTPNIGSATGSISGNAGTVTTNANLTGPITSVGNATSIASQTGTGTKFVVDTSPTLVTPVLGVATGTSLALGGATIGTDALGITGTVTVSGLETAAGFSPTSSTATGNRLYLPAANTLGFAINGTGEVQLTATALSPIANDGNALGTTALGWSDLFLATGAVINWANGEITLTETDANTLTFAGGTFVVGASDALTINSKNPILAITKQVLTSASGTYTPTTGMVYCIVEMVGGGGGGGAANGVVGFGYGGGGGQSGGYARSVLTAADIGASKAYVVGAGGAGGTTADNDGSAGADTTLGTTLVVAKGGAGGIGINTTKTGAGGFSSTTGTGDEAPAGNPGGSGIISAAATSYGAAGYGGSSRLGPGIPGTISTSAATTGASAGANTGGGGSGGSSYNSANDAAGGVGGSGKIIIWEYLKV